MVAQAGVLALPNGIGRNYSRVIGSSAYNNVRSPFQRFHIRLYPHLGIPTITVETYRGYELERRIGDQLDIVEYVLRYYGLI